MPDAWRHRILRAFLRVTFGRHENDDAAADDDDDDFIVSYDD